MIHITISELGRYFRHGEITAFKHFLCGSCAEGISIFSHRHSRLFQKFRAKIRKRHATIVRKLLPRKICFEVSVNKLYRFFYILVRAFLFCTAFYKLKTELNKPHSAPHIRIPRTGLPYFAYFQKFSALSLITFYHKRQIFIKQEERLRHSGIITIKVAVFDFWW